MLSEKSFNAKPKNLSPFVFKIAIHLVFFQIAAILGPSILGAADAKQKYFIAERCYLDLKKDSRLQKYRDQWMRCIDKFQNVYRNDPHGPWAAAGLYMSGELFWELSRRSGKSADKKEAIDTFQRVSKRYPSSRYRKKANNFLEKIGLNEKKEALEQEGKVKKSLKHQTINHNAELIRTTSSDLSTRSVKTAAVSHGFKEKADPDPKKINDFPGNVVTGLRYWSNPKYTRVVIDAEHETDYKENLLRPDPKLNTPRRLYVDLMDTRLGKNVDRIIPINDNLLKDARAGQYSPGTVRVVIDIKTFSKYKIFPLKNPFRIVIDVWGKMDVAASSSQKLSTPIPGNEEVGPDDLARQLALGVSRIVIDPGHGGKDFGAPGYVKGVHEKYVVLDIARKLKKMIERQIGCQVFLTRNSDRYLTLEERTAIANTKDADLFISLHTNASKDRRAFGIETYYLNLATDDEAVRVAAMENATSKKNISDLEAILNDLMQNAKIQESTRLAAFVQRNIYFHLKDHYGNIRNKGVKQAPFYVLLGAQMPAVLIETSFISNHRECKRLINPSYQDHLCRAIVNGIRDYIKATSPTAFLTISPP